MHLKLKRFTAALLALSLLLISTACGTGVPGAGGPESAGSSEALPQGHYSTVSPDRFREAVSGLGEVYDSSEELGFEALAVHTDDELNYIYVMRDTDTQAKEMLFGNEKSPNKGVSIDVAGPNYGYYEEQGTAENGYDVPFYGYYLRVGSMILMVTGKPDNSEQVKEKALTFFKSLGYE